MLSGGRAASCTRASAGGPGRAGSGDVHLSAGEELIDAFDDDLLAGGEAGFDDGVVPFGGTDFHVAHFDGGGGSVAFGGFCAICFRHLGLFFIRLCGLVLLLLEDVNERGGRTALDGGGG